MTEDNIEQNLLETLSKLSWTILHGPEIGPDGSGERDYRDIALNQRLQRALFRLNGHMPQSALDEAFKKLVRVGHSTILENNQAFHKLLTGGVPVQYRGYDGELKDDLVRVVDFDNPGNNEFVAVNQLTVLQSDYNRRPDVALFVNGLPLVLIELKNAADSKADLLAAYRQIQTYQREISDTFRFNELCVISDGMDAAMGTVSSNFERMMPWKTADGEKEVGNVPMLDVLARGVFAPERLLDIVRPHILSQVFLLFFYPRYNIWRISQPDRSDYFKHVTCSYDGGDSMSFALISFLVVDSPKVRVIPSCDVDSNE